MLIFGNIFLDNTCLTIFFRCNLNVADGLEGRTRNRSTTTAAPVAGTYDGAALDECDTQSAVAAAL